MELAANEDNGLLPEFRIGGRLVVFFVPWRASRLGNPSLGCCRTRQSCHLAESFLFVPRRLVSRHVS